MSYARPEYLVETDWVAENLNNPTVRILESDEDPLLYAIGHIPGAARQQRKAMLQPTSISAKQPIALYRMTGSGSSSTNACGYISITAAVRATSYLSVITRAR